MPVRDPTSLAQAMERFVNKPEIVESMGRESWRLAEERFDVHKVNEIILRTMGF